MSTKIRYATNTCDFHEVAVGGSFTYNGARFTRVGGKDLPMYTAMALENRGNYLAHHVYTFDRLCKVTEGGAEQVELKNVDLPGLFNSEEQPMSQYKVKAEKTTFVELAAGEHFLYEGKRYMRIVGAVLFANAVSIENGKVVQLALDTEVTTERSDKLCKAKDLGAGEYFLYHGELMQAPQTKGVTYNCMGGTGTILDDTEVVRVKSVVVTKEANHD